ncbi:DNA-binding GntR family transcriptional regulator [Streptosporangium album]|uniref:DNA-binding GntR family transcriptional regulator n=1 Tax=Streptosporangium album TaxID=47479 RepID=A0A7W7W881_9ACTN|nr:GntR family transcriptional regulator [Streptosporangium album]MBB4937663.1 DNA-binding GntR family transcriptional regulator [Streptosporangium album]
MAVARRLLREQVRDEVLDRLFRGEYPVGSRINEVHLAAEIGVSRTPLREALASLAQEGILDARPNRGYWVSVLSEQEVRDTYPIIAQLEVLAVKLSDPEELARRAPELIELAEKMATAADVRGVQRADDEWHASLLEACPNARLLEMITDTKRIVHRYEHAYLGDPHSVRESIEQHKRIARALQEQDFAVTFQELESNWKTSMHRLVARITGSQDAIGD